MEKFDGFYEKFPGSYIAYIGFIFSVAFISIAVLLYSATEPSFTIFTHYISDLGAASASSTLVFNVGMIISAPIRIIFGFYLLKFLEQRGADEKPIKIAAYAIVSGAIGSTILSIFPHDVLRIMHMLGAFIYFFSVVIVQITISKRELRAENIPKYLPYVGLAVIALPVLNDHISLPVFISKQ